MDPNCNETILRLAFEGLRLKCKLLGDVIQIHAQVPYTQGDLRAMYQEVQRVKQFVRFETEFGEDNRFVNEAECWIKLYQALHCRCLV